MFRSELSASLRGTSQEQLNRDAVLKKHRG